MQMNSYKIKNPSIRELSIKNAVEITKVRPGCFLVTLNGKPISEFAEEAAAILYAARWGYKDGSSTAANEKLAANEQIMQAVGPRMAFAL